MQLCKDYLADLHNVVHNVAAEQVRAFVSPYACPCVRLSVRTFECDYVSVFVRSSVKQTHVQLQTDTVYTCVCLCVRTPYMYIRRFCSVAVVIFPLN